MGTWPIVFSVYAVLMIAGGVMGYRKAGSRMSLIMGLVSGIVIAVGVGMTNKSAVCGYSIIATMSGILTVTFLIRLIKTRKMMPAGMLFFLSLIACGLSVCQIMK